MDDAEVTRYLPGSILAHVNDFSFWDKFCALSSRDFKYAIVERTAKALIGIVGLFGVNGEKHCAQTGTLIGAKEYWRTGRAFEAKMLSLDLGFRVLGLRFVFCKINPQNLAARNHVERCGYRLLQRTDLDFESLIGTDDKLTYVLFAERWAPAWKMYLSSL